MSSSPLFILDLEIDEFQTEKISIFAEKEIPAKLSHFFKNYSINNPDFKKKIFRRVTRFFEHIKNQNLFEKPLNASSSDFPTNRSSHKRSFNSGTLKKTRSRSRRAKPAPDPAENEGIRLVNNIDFKPPGSLNGDASDHVDSEAAPDKGLIYNEAGQYSRQLTFKREPEQPEPAKPVRKKPRRSKAHVRHSERHINMAKNKFPRRSQQEPLMAHSVYLKTPPQTMKKNKSSYMGNSEGRRGSQKKSPYQSVNRQEKVSKLKDITEEFIQRSKRNIFFQEDQSDSKDQHKKRPSRPEQPKPISFKQAPSSEYNTIPSQANTVKMNHSRRRPRTPANKTHNQFYSKSNQRLEAQQLKKNSSAAYLKGVQGVPAIGAERMTAPHQANPFANLYGPRDAHPAQAVSGQSQFVFVSKKDAQVYQLRNVRDEHGQNKQVLVNVRDKSVKGLRSISSVKSITSIKEVSHTKKPLKPKLKKKKKKKKKRSSPKNKHVSSSMFNNVPPERAPQQKRRKKSFNLSGRSREAMMLPNKYTTPQQILPSNSEFDEQVVGTR